jgi:hypothetical protein
MEWFQKNLTPVTPNVTPPPTDQLAAATAREHL